MELKDYERYPSLEDYVAASIETAFGTTDWEEAQQRCLVKTLADHIPYNATRFGPYPARLQPFLDHPPYRLVYRDGKIAGRLEETGKSQGE